MKFLCILGLTIFILFLATPTIVSIIDKSVDTSYFFNMGEEENHDALNEIKSVAAIYSIPISVGYEALQKVQFSIFNNTKINSTKPNVFVPPPELA